MKLLKLVTCYGSASTRSRVITFFKKSKTFFFWLEVFVRTYPKTKELIQIWVLDYDYYFFNHMII